MSLFCTGCGLPARPYDRDCRSCGVQVQNPEAARAKYDEWMAAPAAVIQELEKGFAETEAAHREYLAWLKRNGRIHAVLGAVLLSIPLSMTAIHPSWLCLGVDLAGGAWLGHWLNKVRGGLYHGMWGFFGAAMGSMVFKIVTRPGGVAGWLENGGSLAGAFVIVVLPVSALALMMGLGALMGKKLEFDWDRQI